MRLPGADDNGRHAPPVSYGPCQFPTLAGPGLHTCIGVQSACLVERACNYKYMIRRSQYLRAFNVCLNFYLRPYTLGFIVQRKWWGESAG